MDNLIANEIYGLIEKLFPICRSITGEGFRKSLKILSGVCPIKETLVATGTKVFDWTVPKEWNIRGGYIESLSGEKIIDFKDSNLHIMGYSTPIDAIVSIEELNEHLYTDADLDAIPYATSYYEERWGFCLSKRQKAKLIDKEYHVVIDSDLTDGHLSYGEIFLPAADESQKREVLISTYLCHPSMANNELSGPCVSIYLAKALSERTDRQLNYRFVFVPETIGSITFLSQNIEALAQNVIAGFVLSCVGDDGDYSVIESRKRDTLSERALKSVLQTLHPDYKSYSFLQRGSDERQYCSPLIGLPVCGFCRTKYGEYAQYHTSKDDLSFVKKGGVYGAYNVMCEVFKLLEGNNIYVNTLPCEPQLGKRGLQTTISQKGIANDVKVIRDLLAYADGEADLISIAEDTLHGYDEMLRAANVCFEHGLIRTCAI